jgi:hypothetical protein
MTSLGAVCVSGYSISQHRAAACTKILTDQRKKTNTRQSIIGATEKRQALKSFDFSFFSTGCAVCPLVRSRDIRCHPCAFVSIDTTHVVTKPRML